MSVCVHVHVGVCVRADDCVNVCVERNKEEYMRLHVSLSIAFDFPRRYYIE